MRFDGCCINNHELDKIWVQFLFPLNAETKYVRLLITIPRLLSWMKNPGTPFRLEMRADSLSSNEEVSDLSTSTSRGVFP